MFVLGPLLHNTAAMSGGGGVAFTPASLSGITWDLENIPASVLNSGATPATDLQTAYKWNSQTGGLNVNDGGGGVTFEPVWHANSGANGWLHFDSTNDTLQSTATFAGTNAAGSYYLAVMINFDSVAANYNCIELVDATSANRYGFIRVLAGGTMQAIACDNAFGIHGATGAVVTAGGWHTVIMSMDGVGGTVDVWVDGVVGTQGTGITPFIGTSLTNLFVPNQTAGGNGSSLKAAIHGTGTISSGNVASLHSYLSAL